MPRKSLALFPVVVDGWRSVRSEILADADLDVLKPSDYLVRLYIDSKGDEASLYIGYWQSQRRGAQVHSPKNCLPGGGWEPIEASEAHRRYRRTPLLLDGGSVQPASPDNARRT